MVYISRSKTTCSLIPIIFTRIRCFCCLFQPLRPPPSRSITPNQLGNMTVNRLLSKNLFLLVPSSNPHTIEVWQDGCVAATFSVPLNHEASYDSKQTTPTLVLVSLYNSVCIRFSCTFLERYIVCCNRVWRQDVAHTMYKS